MKRINGLSDEHLLYLKKRKRDRHFIFLMRWVVLIALLVLWEGLTALGVVDSFVFSSPSRIFESIITLTKSGEIFSHIGITLYETLAGFIIATVLGTGIALLLWWNETLRKITEPYIVVLNSLPKIALGPVIIIWFGSGTKSIIVMAVLITVIVTAITMLGGFAATEESKIRLMRSMGASKFQMLIKLVIPSSLPTFINMLKINIGMSWIGSIMGEYLVSRAGLGYLIVYGGQVFRMDLVFAATLILCLLATGMYALVAFLEKAVMRRRK